MEKSALQVLFDNVTVFITNILKVLGTVSKTLMSNEIFQITMGVVVLGIAMGIIFTLVKKAKRKGR